MPNDELFGVVYVPSYINSRGGTRTSDLRGVCEHLKLAGYSVIRAYSVPELIEHKPAILVISDQDFEILCAELGFLPEFLDGCRIISPEDHKEGIETFGRHGQERYISELAKELFTEKAEVFKW